MTTANPNKPLLFTIATSHYCEKVRWAMDWLGIDYVEESHAPPFHRKYTSRYGGTSVPVLVVNDKAFTDSKDILHYLDTIASGQKLYPQDPELRRQAETLEKLFDDKLGGATRNWAYYYAIQQPWSILAAWSKGISWIEKIQCAIAFPVATKIIKQKYNLTLEGKETAVQDIKEVFTIVNQKLLGQQYLVGDRFSATDITFAALASPVIRPEYHPVYSSQLSKLPTEMVAVVQDLRATPAGELVMRMYRERRRWGRCATPPYCYQ
jgi:glutathione S-transferase